MKNPGQKPTIETQRRRPGSSGPSGPRERADAPQRERDSGASGGGTSRPTGGYSGGGMSSGGGINLPKGPLGIGMMILLVVCGLIYNMLGGGGDSETPLDSGYTEPVYEQPTNEPAVVEPTATKRPTQKPAAPSSSAGGTKWTVILYQDADDKILEQDIFMDINEAERVGSSANLNIVAQLDRYQGAFSGDGNWTGTRRYYIQQDDDLNRIHSEIVQDLGEVNMADGNTLVDFVTWAIQNYPADKYVLIMGDHGMGWPGGWSDASATGKGGRLPLQAMLGDNIYLNELSDALGKIRSATGIDKFELIGMDACLMGHIEVLSALEPYSRYAVVSQEVEPALGWAYASFLSELTNNSNITGGQLGQIIVDSYIVDDQRIVDDGARAELVGRGSPIGSLYGASNIPSAAAVARQLGQNVTLTAADLQALPDLIDSLNALAVKMQGADQRHIAQARSYAQSFTNIFGSDVPPPYIDLGNFAALMARSSGKRDIAEGVNTLAAAIDRVVVAEKHGPRISGATGISIYFPTSAVYRSPAAGATSYTGIANRFAEESLWDEFLAFHYTGETFEADSRAASVPAPGAMRSPASGGIQVSTIAAGASAVSIGQKVRLSVDIEGANVGYIKLLVGYLDQNANSIYVADSDYLSSPDTKEVGGVYYPDWGVDAFSMAFEWEPIIFAINDGSKRYPALFTPAVYGAAPEQAAYTIEGVYTFADSGEQLNARLIFVNGVLQQVYGFTGESEAAAPREITPQPGDMFTILDKWMDLDAQGNVKEVVRQVGNTLTFSDRMFTWEVMDAAAGQYVVGFIIEDLDGNAQAVYTPIVVR